MRTTIALDDDVAARLQALMRESGMGMKAALNATLRLGFEVRASRSRRKPHTLPTFDLGETRPGIDLDNIGELLEIAEGSDYK